MKAARSCSLYMVCKWWIFFILFNIFPGLILIKNRLRSWGEKIKKEIRITKAKHKPSDNCHCWELQHIQEMAKPLSVSHHGMGQFVWLLGSRDMTHSQPGDQREVLKGECWIKQAPCKRRTVLILVFEIWFIKALQHDCKTWPSPCGNSQCSCLGSQTGYMWAAGQCWAGPYFCHWQVPSNIFRCFLYSFENPVWDQCD